MEILSKFSIHFKELIMLRGPLVGQAGEKSDEMKQKIKGLDLNYSIITTIKPQISRQKVLI